jgi:hypothetical protein
MKQVFVNACLVKTHEELPYHYLAYTCPIMPDGRTLPRFSCCYFKIRLPLIGSGGPLGSFEWTRMHLELPKAVDHDWASVGVVSLAARNTLS